MTATVVDGTYEDYLNSIVTNHYLTVIGSNTSPASDSDPFWAVFNGQGDEDHVLYADPSNQALQMHIGYNADTGSQSSGGTFTDGQIYNASYNSDPGAPQSYDLSGTYYYYAGADWHWHVFYDRDEGGSNDRLWLVGSQTVDQIWDYHKYYDAAQDALFLWSYQEGRGTYPDGWAHDSGFGRIDEQQNGQYDPFEDGSTAHFMWGGISQANTWRALDKHVIMKHDDRVQVAGYVDAVGADPQQAAIVPTHLDDVSTASKTYQYIRPVQDSWTSHPLIFRVG